MSHNFNRRKDYWSRVQGTGRVTRPGPPPQMLALDARSTLVPTEPDPALKGKFGGNCNRKDCQKPVASFYNHATRMYYCPKCARTINQYNPESHEIYGHELCTYGEHIETK